MSSNIRLGYLGFHARDLPAWEAFATDVLGLEVGTRAADGTLALRCDDWAQRFVVAPGSSDDVAFLGWEVDDAPALEEAAKRLRSSGVDVADATESAAGARRVARLIAFRDPDGNHCEIFFGADRAPERFRSPHVRSSFVTGAQGLGHVVLGATDPARTQRFYSDVIGFRLSDRIVCQVHGYPVDVTFMHGGPRHQ